MSSNILLADNGVTSGTAGIKTQGGSDGTLQLQTTTSGGTATTALTIDNSQNVGIGTSSPATKFEVSSANNIIRSTGSSGYGAFYANAATGNASYYFFAVNGTESARIFSDSTNYIAFATGSSSTERGRFDSSGNFLVGTTSALGVGFTVEPNATAPFWQLTANTSGTANNFYYYNQNATNNGYRFYVAINGGVYNYSGNNVNLSDERTKTNIELAGNYLDKICAIPVKLFNYKDEAEGEQRTLGVIAQDVEAVAPEFVNNDGWEGATSEDGSQLKTVYSNDMMFALMKCIQELNATVTDLQSKLKSAGVAGF